VGGGHILLGPLQPHHRAASVVAWVMLIGLVANLAVIAVGPTPGSLAAADIAWMLVAGFGNVAGLLLEYAALRRGKVGIVTPITSTEGAIAACWRWWQARLSVLLGPGFWQS